MKTWKWILTGGLLLVAVLPAAVLGPFSLRVREVLPDPAAGFQAGYYLYVSKEALRRAGAGPTCNCWRWPTMLAQRSRQRVCRCWTNF